MYYLLFLLLFMTLLGCIFFHCRRKRIICKINCMDYCSKCSLLDELANPFGYRFHCNSGFFSSTVDAWQKQAGYTSLYDYMAPRFKIVFDALPIYFDYRGRTWLIELWKGQYGINTGAEIGIYHADTIIPEKDCQNTWFSCADEDEMMDCSFLLCDGEDDCIRNSGRHWWLTAFLPGYFSNPSALSMASCICFPNREMLSAFMAGLRRSGCQKNSISVKGLSVCFVFWQNTAESFNLITRFWRRFSQWKNRISCKLYLWVTRPFCCTEDRILYLYYYLPSAFRKLLRLRRFNRCSHKYHCKES